MLSLGVKIHQKPSAPARNPFPVKKKKWQNFFAYEPRILIEILKDSTPSALILPLNHSYKSMIRINVKRS